MIDSVLVTIASNCHSIYYPFIILNDIQRIFYYYGKLDLVLQFHSIIKEIIQLRFKIQFFIVN